MTTVPPGQPDPPGRPPQQTPLPDVPALPSSPQALIDLAGRFDEHLCWDLPRSWGADLRVVGGTDDDLWAAGQDALVH